MSKNIAKLEQLLELTALSSSRFITKYYPLAPVGARGTFGGTLAAQSLLASLNTVPRNFIPTSLHCYFISSGNPKEMIEYEVKSLRQGQNFIHKQINAYQFNKLIFSSMVLFSKDKRNSSIKDTKLNDNVEFHKSVGSGVEDKSRFRPAGELFKQDIMDNKVNLEKFQRLKSRFEDKEYLKQVHDSFETQPLDYRFPLDIFKTERTAKSKLLEYFVRVREDSIKTITEPDKRNLENPHTLISPSNDPRYNYVTFAYLSDSYLLLTLPYFHGLPMYSHTFSVSLDHTIYFHNLPKANDWLRLQLHNIRSMSDRHLIQCEHYDVATGQIVASVSQEGLVAYPPVSQIKARL
ncbi:peroxisomal acyl-coenzyme A thioester hydrolase 1 [Monosporozyma unispora]|nr:hypothetical protein C6P44_001435 [Kazachstania unispora]